VPGYPFWHTSPAVFSAKTFAELWKNSVEVPSVSTHRLGQAAKQANAYVVIGINERCTVTRGTLYNTLLYFAPSGDIIHRHRKLMPTFTERTIWGFGDGSDLDVMETPLGRLGGLICWEHQMTLAKYALYSQGEQVHCATWPAYTSQNHHIDFGMRQYAFEGACFVVSSCGIVTPGSMPKGLDGEHMEANGGSGIIGPDGEYLAGPIYDAEETIYAEIDLEVAIREKHARDIAGHYARPDVLQLLVHAERKPVTSYGTTMRHDEPLEAATAEEVVDRLEAVREYLGSLIERIETDGDSEVNAALVEALASIDMAAAGMWSSK
jgi:aliphatic nitrilase